MKGDKDVEEKIFKHITGYWTNFAEDGDPNTGATVGLTKWPKYAEGSTMIFGTNTRVSRCTLA